MGATSIVRTRGVRVPTPCSCGEVQLEFLELWVVCFDRLGGADVDEAKRRPPFLGHALLLVVVPAPHTHSIQRLSSHSTRTILSLYHSR